MCTIDDLNLNWACEGTTIADYDVDLYDCVAICEALPECNCITWVHSANEHCRLETEDPTLRALTNDYSAISMVEWKNLSCYRRLFVLIYA